MILNLFIYDRTLIQGIKNAFQYRVYSTTVQGTENASAEKNLSFQLPSIFGLMLGDGCLINPNAHKRFTGNYRLEFTFKASMLPFMTWLKFNVLGSLSTRTMPTPYPKNSPTQYWFSTKSLELFTEMQEHWYVWNKEFLVHESTEKSRRIKVLPGKDYFKVHFTEVSLAHWIMGDGYWEKNAQTLFLCTECFTFQEVTFLVQILEDRFGLQAGLKRRVMNGKLTGYRIRLSMRKKNLDKLRELILHYMHPSMLYKIGN